MTDFNSSALIEGARTFGVELSSAQVEAFKLYALRLEEWNQKLNLTRVPAQETVALHFLDSLSVATAIPPNGRLLDVGTGAGFPGIPLKIAFPNLQVCLLDSIQKKLGFIESLSREMGLPLEIVCGRAETLAHAAERRESFDIVVSRAVADLDTLCHWMLPFVKVGGMAVAMKSKETEIELQAAVTSIHILGGGTAEIREVVVPGILAARKLVVIRKERPTPSTLPKRGNIKKKK
ncbi:MAG: 16S rRNA (guanine(527)-N(7))-methyltransferase RsmG [Deltaproteobacteria bacterium]|nr:16S rRNA (guanine(527)-N(7))-methyltransferase RsmG [Deltaproteobacteria bacterium]